MPDTPCEHASQVCSYGSSSDTGCRERYTCYPTGQWRVEQSVGGGCPQPAGQCEEMPEGGCGDVGERCTFEESMCSCNPRQTESCSGDGCQPIEPPIPQQWLCAIPFVREGCPTTIPNAGTQCDDSAMNCIYGDSCSGLYVSCEDGYYNWEISGCP